ncbi:MAG: ribosomal RNA small subunit methyltransferase A [Candidatus Tyloplasma litorale]|nr:MAG: ribosomal RNA small subunit methyltransferase A [Mycoplasmatales bacterium]
MLAKKYLGQNFLIDQNKINLIVNSIPNIQNSIIIEVGPGTGALTKPLSEKAKKVIAIEIDFDMIKILNEKITNKNFTLINKDILDLDWDEIIKSDYKNIQFVSNLPYYISTKIMFKVAYDDRFNSMSVMLQKELVDRIFSKTNSKSYGRLTVSIGTLFNLEKKINIPAGCFKPQPKVDSGFIVLSRKKIDFDLEKYLFFIKCSFSMKRKTLLNSLKKSNFKKYELVKKYLEENKIKLNIRSEEIEINEFIKIFKYINKK